MTGAGADPLDKSAADLSTLSCVKELAGFDLGIAGLNTCMFSLRLVRFSPYGVSATAQITAVAAGSSRPRRYVGGFLSVRSICLAWWSTGPRWA